MLRLVYGVSGALRFSGHLDIAGELARWLKRARVDVQYSEGFNPHPKMSFAQPKPVGMTAYNELVDIFVESLGLLPDFEMKMDFPGAQNGTPMPESMNFEYPNSIAQLPIENPHALSDSLYEFTRTGWFSECNNKLSKSANRSVTGDTDCELERLRSMLFARSHHLISILSLRILSATDFELSHIIESALYYIELHHDNAEDAVHACDWLTGGDWTVERKPGDKPADMHAQTIEVVVERNENSIGIGVLGFARPNATFSAMRIVNHCVRRFNSIPMRAIRLGFFDSYRNPVF